jgi:hypothetical protein
MKSVRFSTPILLLVFNRPDYFVRMISVLRKLKPTQLYISGDGARKGNSEDEICCHQIQEAVKLIDWPCQVQTFFRTKNLGCKKAVHSGISWFFTLVEEGIILEDDCLPDPTFFPFCAQLLKKYRNTSQVWHISGSNFISLHDVQASYSFSMHPLSWGWATWRRAWKKYDVAIKDWPTQQEQILRQFISRRSRNYWKTILDLMYKQKIDTWDYQWIYLIWKHKGLSIIPSRNLVTNIGFDHRATHTKLFFSPLANYKVKSMEFPLKHPIHMYPNTELDQKIQALFEESRIGKVVRGFTQMFLRQVHT